MTDHEIPELLGLQGRLVTDEEALLLGRLGRLDILVVLGEHGLLVAESGRF